LSPLIGQPLGMTQRLVSRDVISNSSIDRALLSRYGKAPYWTPLERDLGNLRVARILFFLAWLHLIREHRRPVEQDRPFTLLIVSCPTGRYHGDWAKRAS
jgi:hypothetical protein